MTPTTSRRKVTIIMRIILFLSFGMAVFFAVYFYRQCQEISNEQGKAQKEIETIKNSLSKILIVPEEEPVLATVTDKTKLEQQNFFKQAENGDKVVIYKEAGKAILFRPSANKIVDITVINVSEELKNTNTDTNTAVENKVETTNSITIYNGTETTGLATQISSEITDNVKNIAIEAVAKATKTNYEKTVIVLNNTNATEKANEIATLIDASLGELPEGEQNPNTDILIILGSDKIQNN